MKNSKLWQLLQTLDAEELRRLTDFVASPYFNRRPEALRLLEAMLPMHKEAPAKEAVFPLVFPDQPYHDHRLRQAMSFLYKLCLDFMAISTFQDNPVEVGRFTAEALRRRLLSEAGERVLQETAEKLRSAPFRNADYFDSAYRLVLETYRMSFEHVAYGGTDIQGLSDQLDTAYMARKLWQACFIWSHETVSNTAYDYGLLPQVMAHIEQRGVPLQPAVSAYYHCFRALSTPEEAQHFRQFLNIIMENGAVFPDEELRDLYVLALNFCIRQNNAGSTAYHQAQFELYRQGMVKGYFTSDGYLPRYTYLNAVTTALVVEAYDWAEQFTDNYRNQLPVEFRKALWRFNHARLAYARKQTDRALELLREVDVRDLMLQLAAKTLQVKIFYEIGAFDLLESHLQALNTFIRRKKDLGYHRANYLNLIRLLRERLEIPPLDRAAKNNWLQQVKQTAELAERAWLLGL